MATVTPLGGRLAQILSLRTFLAVTNLLFAIGLLRTATARTVSDFIIGRILAGCGASGMYSTQTILVLELCSKKRRGLYLGCLYTIITVGVASGAIIAGAVTPKYGWVKMAFSQRLCFPCIADAIDTAIDILCSISNMFYWHPDSLLGNPANWQRKGSQSRGEFLCQEACSD